MAQCVSLEAHYTQLAEGAKTAVAAFVQFSRYPAFLAIIPPMHIFRILPLLWLALALAACATTSSSSSDSASDRSDLAAPAGDEARVVNVIDGDTVDVVVNGREYRLRYIGVDTPERDEPFYEDATRYNRDLVGNQTVILVKDVSDTDRFGRLLRYVYLPDGTFVNAALIQNGYGRVVSFPPDVAQVDYFAELQAEARSDNRGLWASSEMQALPAGCDTCSKNSYDCRDFETQPQAQACFDACMALAGEDVHNLDGGGDGVVCESLPRN